MPKATNNKIDSALLSEIVVAGMQEVKAEDIVVSYLEYLDKLSRTIEISDKKLKELDKGGVFEKDDEVGVIFQSIIKIQEILNEFNVRKYNRNA